MPIGISIFSGRYEALPANGKEYFLIIEDVNRAEDSFWITVRGKSEEPGMLMRFERIGIGAKAFRLTETICPGDPILSQEALASNA